MFGIADQVGSIEPGKMANLIVTNGDPLEIATQVKYLFIKGQLTSTSTSNRQSDLYEEYRKRPGTDRPGIGWPGSAPRLCAFSGPRYNRAKFSWLR